MRRIAGSSQRISSGILLIAATTAVLAVGGAVVTAIGVQDSRPTAAVLGQLNVPARASSSATRLQAPSALGGFPTLSSVGVPTGWTPAQTVTGPYTVTSAGAVVEDLRINGSLIIDAPNVTVRRVEVVGGTIDNYKGPTCQKGLVLEDTSIVLPAGQTMKWDPVLLAGSYTARRLKVDGVPEGVRVGAVDDGCGPVTIQDSYIRVVAPANCGNVDWHGDGLQGFGGPPLTVRNSVIEMVETSSCRGTAPFFYPSNQGNTSVDIDGLIVKGGGYPFRLGMPGPVRNLNIVNNSWSFGPIDVKCSVVTAWDARIVTLDANGQPVPVRSQPCNTEGGN